MVQQIISGIGYGEATAPQLERALREYAELMQPWARSVASKMLADVSRSNYQLWKQNSAEMGRLIKGELATTPLGARTQGLMAENVDLIQSIPRKAAERVHELAVQRLSNSIRSSEMVDEIMQLGGVTKRRAKLIARTEVSRANASLLQSRSEMVGSEGYIWRTVGDYDVRESHKKLDGQYIRWDSPPTTDGMVGHAGCTPNCRCTAEPILPGETIEYVKSLGRQRTPHAKGEKNEIKPERKRSRKES